MYNKAVNKNPMPVQDAGERKNNFKEVALGYSKETAIDEANRCLGCKRPTCVDGCPVKINIPDFITHVKEGEFEEAFQVISKDSSLPAICGRVCPQESQCEAKCVRGKKSEPVGIGRLERFVADFHNNNDSGQALQKPEPKNKKVAIVGSGPAGLTCAGELAKKGYQVTIFEALHVAGGVLVYGIPEFRLPKSIVQKEIDSLIELGVEVRTNFVIGRTKSIDELLENEGFDAIFIGSGAGLPKFMNIPGINLNGVLSANEFLTRVNLMKAYKDDSKTPIMHAKHVVVVGGGNVAMDAARCAKRLGSKVTIVYRRTQKELPARAEEVEHALEEDITFEMLTNPISIEADENGSVKSVTCQKMELGEPDESGRRRPIPIEGKTQVIETDCVIMALGTSPNPLIADTTPGLKIQSWGGVIVDEESCATSKDSVYAGGDVVSGAATVILAMGAGKQAAASIDKQLS